MSTSADRPVRLAEYQERYRPAYELSRTEDGILVVEWRQRQASDAQGYPVKAPDDWGPTLQRAEELWHDVSYDYENKVVILTGHGDTFYTSHEVHARPGEGTDADGWSKHLLRLPRSISAFLDIPTILIGAANGPATVHAEYLLLCDLVVASETAVFQDLPHFTANTVPGDGVNVIWPLLLGWNRGRDFLLTGRSISAYEALDLGLVREVVKEDEVLPRSHELAREMLRQDDLTRRMTAHVLRRQLKDAINAHLQHSLALEAIVFLDQRPRGR